LWRKTNQKFWFKISPQKITIYGSDKIWETILRLRNGLKTNLWRSTVLPFSIALNVKCINGNAKIKIKQHNTAYFWKNFHKKIISQKKYTIINFENFPLVVDAVSSSESHFDTGMSYNIFGS